MVANIWAIAFRLQLLLVNKKNIFFHSNLWSETVKVKSEQQTFLNTLEFSFY